MAESDDSFELFDLRVEAVVPEGKPIYCGAKAGDYFELTSDCVRNGDYWVHLKHK